MRPLSSSPTLESTLNDAFLGLSKACVDADPFACTDLLLALLTLLFWTVTHLWALAAVWTEARAARTMKQSTEHPQARQ